MEREPLVIATTERGRISIAHSAVVQIVGAAAAESYGVVALAGRAPGSGAPAWRSSVSGLRSGPEAIA